MKVEQIFTFILLMIASYTLKATTFIPVPIDEQLESATGVIHGKYLGKTYKLGPDEKVFTEYSFRVFAKSGLGEEKFHNTNIFKVLVPGGRWLGVVHHISGSPRFRINEEVILVVKKGTPGYLLHNFTLGKYKISKGKLNRHLISEVFPYHPNLGKIPLASFNKKLIERFGGPLAKIKKRDKFVHTGERQNSRTPQTSPYKKRKRAPASMFIDSEGNDQVEDKKALSMFWLTFLLGIMAFSSLYLARKKAPQRKTKD